MQEKTGSRKGAAVLAEWDKYLGQFWQLVPPSEAETPEAAELEAPQQLVPQSA